MTTRPTMHAVLLAGELGIEDAEAAVLCRAIARGAVQWTADGPIERADQLARLVARTGDAWEGMAPGRILELLRFARILAPGQERDKEGTEVAFSTTFSAEIERTKAGQERDRDKKRGQRAAKVGTEWGQDRDTEGTSRAGADPATTTTAASLPTAAASSAPAAPSGPPPCDTGDYEGRTRWVLWHAREYGYGSLSKAVWRILLAHFDDDPENAPDDIARAFAATDGAGNKRAMLVSMLGRAVEFRHRGLEVRAPPGAGVVRFDDYSDRRLR